MKKTGVLLINLGTPEAPETEPVGNYLKQFLMDPLVIDIPYLFRWFLVNVIIVPRRASASAALYKKVWTDRGSPLLFHTLDLLEKVKRLLGEEYAVELGMRYGEPSIENAIAKLKAAGVHRWLVFPLYPQYSLAATESSVTEVRRLLPNAPITFIPAFYNRGEYLDAVAEVSRAPLAAARADYVLFSFHGLPERQVKKTDPSHAHCLVKADCCDRIENVNGRCYRAQCFATARSLRAKLGISEATSAVTFQSRLNERWIRPFTDDFYRDLPKRGIKRVAVICPSFVADCLETVEEVAIRGNEEFRRHGGEEIVLIPSLNAADLWAEAVQKILLNQSP